MNAIIQVSRQLSATPSPRLFVLLCILCAVFIVAAAIQAPLLYDFLGFINPPEEWVRTPILAIAGLSAFACALMNMKTLHRYSFVRVLRKDRGRAERLQAFQDAAATRPELLKAHQYLHEEQECLKHQYGFMLNSKQTYGHLKILGRAIAAICWIWSVWLIAHGVDAAQFLPFVEWLR